MALDCDPSVLANNARCFARCIPDGLQPAIQTYLLAVIANSVAGTSMDPQALMTAALSPPNSFMVVDGVQVEVQTYLLCAIAQASGA